MHGPNPRVGFGLGPGQQLDINAHGWASLFTVSAPGFLLFPAPRAADAGVFDAEIELLDVVLVEKPGAAVFHHDASGLEHVTVIGGAERHVGVLLDQQNADPALAVDAPDDLED